MSRDLCLTLFDTAGIQDYIFGANRLMENVGASYLVDQTLTTWLEQACRDTSDGQVVWRSVEDEPVPLRLPADTVVAAELLYAGGGNAAVLFRSREAAVRAVHCWSRRVLLDAPGIRVAVAHRTFAPGGLSMAWQEARSGLAAAKAGAPMGQPLQGMSLSRTCRSTGLAAAGWPAPETGREADRRLPGPDRRAARCLSPVAACRLAAVDAANAHLARTFGTALAGPFAFTEDIEQLGQRPGEQHVAVVHADGNGLGERFDRACRGADDAAVAVAVRAFARSIHQASSTALHGVLAAVAAGYDSLVRREGGLVARADRLGRAILPVRPIVFGGDDVTVVCHGRLGLWLAASYVRRFAACRGADGVPLSACAGVAIVHTRAPFARAYGLATELCTSAKRRARADAVPGMAVAASWLDAHLALEGVGESLEQVRRRRLVPLPSGGVGQLDWRPWRVGPAQGDDRDWDTVAGWMRTFAGREDGPTADWPASVRRSVLDSLAAGPAASAAALARQQFRGRTLPPLHAASADDGWTSRPSLGVELHNQATPYFDPLELAEYYWEVPE